MKHTKILSLLLAVLLLALLGCGGCDKTAGTTQSGEKTGTVEGAVETAPAATEAPQAETPQEENPREEAAPAEEGPLTGALQNNVYTNEYFALGCTLDENWRFNTREEIAQFNSETAEMFDDEDVKAALEDGSYYMDMSAEADEGLVHIKAVIENIGVIYGITMDESGYIDAALENNDLNAMFTAMGMENVKMEKNEVELAGAAHAGLRIEAEYQGISIYQQVVAVKKNSYVMTVICACRDEDILSTMLGYFYALD